MTPIKIAIMLIIFGRNNLLNMDSAREAVARQNTETRGVVELVVKKTARQRRDPCSRFQGIAQRYGKYACMKSWAYAHGYLRPRRLFSALIEPAVDAQGVWSYGFASGICDLSYGFTMSTFARVNAQGLDRREYSITAAQHELAHLEGARHIEGCGLEDSDALACIVPGVRLHLEPENLTRIRSCTWRD